MIARDNLAGLPARFHALRDELASGLTNRTPTMNFPVTPAGASRIARESHEVARARQGKFTCSADPLNPCWDGRPGDVVGKHWGGGDACPNCTARAKVRP